MSLISKPRPNQADRDEVEPVEQRPVPLRRPIVVNQVPFLAIWALRTRDGLISFLRLSALQDRDTGIISEYRLEQVGSTIRFHTDVEPKTLIETISERLGEIDEQDKDR